MHTNHYFPWHFDGNEFTLSILVQKAEKGGLFEYAPSIRSKDNENFENVKKVLKGDRKLVKSLDLKPGDLQIFKGRFSMHRVTKIEGKISRYIALPCYVKDPLKICRSPGFKSKDLTSFLSPFKTLLTFSKLSLSLLLISGAYSNNPPFSAF